MLPLKTSYVWLPREGVNLRRGRAQYDFLPQPALQKLCLFITVYPNHYGGSFTRIVYKHIYVYVFEAHRLMFGARGFGGTSIIKVFLWRCPAYLFREQYGAVGSCVGHAFSDIVRFLNVLCYFLCSTGRWAHVWDMLLPISYMSF